MRRKNFPPVAQIRVQDSHCRRQFAFAVLLGDFDIRRIITAVPVFFDCSEDVPDNFVLPWQKIERHPTPLPFGMLQAVDKVHGVLRLFFINHPCHRP